MTRPSRIVFASLGLAMSAGCTRMPPPPVVVATPPVAPDPIVGTTERPAVAPHVETRRCPTPADIAKLREARPRPLREQKMPATTSERVARVAAQLGLYEAQGQWADQVERAFRKCEDHPDRP